MERARIDAFVDAIRGGAHALLIRGEPGIGKSALWRYALDRARATGYLVRIARPSVEDLRLTLGTLVELFDGTPVDTMALTAADPLTRGRATLAAIRALAADGPVLLAIDDLQWMDLESARAMRHALRRLDSEPVGVVGTVREGPIGDPLETLQGLPPGRSDGFIVGPLDLEGTRRLVRPYGAGIARPVLARIHGISGGNPLYSIELARSLPHDRSAQAADIRPPASVRTVIADRVAGLPPDMVEALQVVAVLGPASLREVREALGTDDLGALLAPAREADLLVVEEGRVRFAHPLIASVVYEGLDPIGRRSLHARMAAMARDPDPRARHLALSADDPDSDVAAELEAASGRAAERDDFQLAAEFAAHAARLTPGDDPDGLLRRQIAEIEARIGAGESARALALADALAASLPRGPARAQVLVSRSYADDDELDIAERRLLDALDDAGDDEGLRGTVLERLVDAGVRATPESVARLEEALAIGRRRGDQGLVVRTLSMLSRTHAMAGTPRPELALEAIGVYEAGARDPLTTDPRDLFAKELVWAGELRRARALLDTVWAELGGVGSELQRMQTLYDRSLLACAAGELDEASGLVQRGREMAIDAEEIDGLAKFDALRALVAVWRGETAAAMAIIDPLLPQRERRSRDTPVRLRWIRALLAASRGDHQTALADLRQALALQEEAGLRHPGMIPILPDSIAAAVGCGAMEEAAELVELLEERAAPIGTPWATAVVARARGVVLLADGATDAAIVSLRDAIALFDGTGHRTDAARTALALGRAQLRGGQRVAAAEALDDARTRFEGIGAPLWVTQCERELERVAPGRVDGALTPTERRVAELVATGARNKEVAAALFVSTANVEAHLTRIFRKLDLRSRADLVRWMASQGDAVDAPVPADEGRL